MRRRVRRRRRTLGGVLLALGVTLAVWLVAAGKTSDSTPPAAVVHAPPAIEQPIERPEPTGKAPPPGIDLFGERPIKKRFEEPPRAGVLFDVRTGDVLWAYRPLRRLPIASVTKIMTAIIVTEHTKPGDRARVTHEALRYSGSGVGVLPRKKLVPVEALLAGMLLPSGNDAALALAGHVAGNDDAFVRLMNRRARQMGLGCTRYASSDGLSDRNRSCPADLAALTRVAMGKRRIARIVRRRQLELPFPIKSGKLWLNSTNPLLRTGYPGTVGLKTGYTRKAGHCFVAVARRGGRMYGVVLLDSPNTERQARKLLDRAFRLDRRA
jgi:D-alanyl-D-alanine carboxypeptidase